MIHKQTTTKALGRQLLLRQIAAVLEGTPPPAKDRPTWGTPPSIKNRPTWQVLDKLLHEFD